MPAFQLSHSASTWYYLICIHNSSYQRVQELQFSAPKPPQYREALRSKVKQSFKQTSQKYPHLSSAQLISSTFIGADSVFNLIFISFSSLLHFYYPDFFLYCLAELINVIRFALRDCSLQAGEIKTFCCQGHKQLLLTSPDRHLVLRVVFSIVPVFLQLLSPPLLSARSYSWAIFALKLITGLTETLSDVSCRLRLSCPILLLSLTSVTPKCIPHTSNTILMSALPRTH